MGKGSKRRPEQVPRETFEEAWRRTFEQVEEPKEPPKEQQAGVAAYKRRLEGFRDLAVAMNAECEELERAVLAPSRLD